MFFEYEETINKDEAVILLLLVFNEVDLELDYEDEYNMQLIEELAETISNMGYPEYMLETFMETAEQVSLGQTKLGGLL